jgi:hypothetical protein
VFDPTYEAALAERGLAPAPVPLAPGSIEGIVVEAGSGRPLPLATVQVQARSGPESAGVQVTTTRADGTFTFRSVAAGPFLIQADLAGYIPGNLGIATDPYSPIQQLLPGQKLSGIRLALTRGAVISGRLIDDRGDVVVGAVVQAMKTTYKDGLRERTTVQSTVSNDLGEYRLFMLRPGEYHVSILPGGLRALPYFFPGTIDAKASQPIELHEGEALAGVNFSAMPTRTRRVTGTVQGNSGEGVSVMLSPLNGTSSIKQTLDVNTGLFQFVDIAPGSYTVVAKTTSLRSAISLDVRNADMLNMRISLGSGFRIPAHVRIDGHPPGDDPDLENIYFVARPGAAIPGLEGETYSPFSNGRFTLDLFAGKHYLDITRPPDAYVKAMTLGGVDVLNQGLQVTGSTDQTLEIVIASSVGSVAGRTMGRDATVVLVPDAARRGQRSLYRSIKAVGSGEFRFEKVPPGDYKLFAWTEENGGPWLDPEYLRKYEDLGTPVHIDADRRTILDRAIPVF